MTSPVVGGYYAYRVHPKDAKRLFVKGRRRERAYRVVKVWRVDDQGVWLAVFGELFTGPPVSLGASNLTTYFATLPLARRTFDGLSAECILTADVAPEETEGWRLHNASREASATPRFAQTSSSCRCWNRASPSLNSKQLIAISPGLVATTTVPMCESHSDDHVVGRYAFGMGAASAVRIVAGTQGEADQRESDPDDQSHGRYPERHDRREQRCLQERGVRRDRPVRVFLVELGVGLAPGDLLGVLVDHLCLAVGRERVANFPPSQGVGVFGDDDLLLRESW